MYKANNITIIQEISAANNKIEASFHLLKNTVSYVKFTRNAQGSNYGYNSGGTFSSRIDRFPFAVATTNATNVGDLSLDKSGTIGQSSQTHGYASGGQNITYRTVIERFPFSSTTASVSSVGDLSVARGYGSGQSSFEAGYASSGQPNSPGVDVIDRFPFTTATTNAVDVGDLSSLRSSSAGQSSQTHGYVSGGTIPTPARTNIIDRFPFTSDGTATDVGDLTVIRNSAAGQSSETHGYTSGGTTPGTPAAVNVNTIDRFPFAVAVVNATDVGDLTGIAADYAGQSSMTHGYYSASAPVSIDIQRWPFAATTTNATEIGNLSTSRQYASSQQN